MTSRSIKNFFFVLSNLKSKAGRLVVFKMWGCNDVKEVASATFRFS